MRTEIGKSNGNLFARDADHPPANGSMWDDCPLLAYLQDPSIGHLYMNHFHSYNAADWTTTTTEDGAGDATEAITDEAGGVLLITNDAGDDDSDEFQLKGEAYQLLPGKPFWLEGKWKVSDSVESDFLFGACITDTELIDGMTDGVYFLKSDASTALTYHCEKDSTDTSANTGLAMADATWIRPGIKFDGEGHVEYWVNGVKIATSATNIPDDELLRLSFAIQNGEAVAKTLSGCYIKAFQIL